MAACRLQRVASLAAVAALLGSSCFVSAGTYYDNSGFYSNDGNLALGKPTSQSSEGWAGESWRGVDGGASGRFWDGSCTLTQNKADQNSWWTVNLESAAAIKTIVLYLRNDASKGIRCLRDPRRSPGSHAQAITQAFARTSS